MQRHDLEQALANVPIADAHCHPPLRDGEELPLRDFRGCFTEARDPAVLDAQVLTSLHFQHALPILADVLGCDPVEQAILGAMRARALDQRVRAALSHGNVDTLIVDDGFQFDRLASIERLAELARPATVSRIVRIEAAAERLVPLAAGLDDLQARLDDHIISSGAVGLKSIIAYRSGLNLEPANRSRANQGLAAARATYERGGTVRLTDKPLLDSLLWSSLRTAARLKLPVQFHTGFGDTDADLRLGNPLHLRPIFEDTSLRSAPIVLLHCYPYVREAAYLASVYSNAYVDLSQTIPHLTFGGGRALGDALGLAPSGKVMYGSDAHTVPEMYAVGATWARRNTTALLADWIDQGLDENRALEIARRFLGENTRALYQQG
ncbi:MAG: amidohydrolase family protein [Chloroflexota bacterium]